MSILEAIVKKKGEIDAPFSLVVELSDIVKHKVLDNLYIESGDWDEESLAELLYPPVINITVELAYGEIPLIPQKVLESIEQLNLRITYTEKYAPNKRVTITRRSIIEDHKNDPFPESVFEILVVHYTEEVGIYFGEISSVAFNEMRAVAQDIAEDHNYTQEKEYSPQYEILLESDYIADETMYENRAETLDFATALLREYFRIKEYKITEVDFSAALEIRIAEERIKIAEAITYFRQQKKLQRKGALTVTVPEAEYLLACIDAAYAVDTALNSGTVYQQLLEACQNIPSVGDRGFEGIDAKLSTIGRYVKSVADAETAQEIKIWLCRVYAGLAYVTEGTKHHKDFVAQQRKVLIAR